MSVLIFFIVLSVLILVHEFGHYWVAKRSGVWVEEFGLGIPPRAIGKKIGETLYSLNWLPFGGFVRLHGENPEDKIIKKDRAFVNKSKKTRAAIVSAGVVMNFLLALVCFAFVYSVQGIPLQTDNVRFIELREGAPAIEAGVLPGDVVREVNGVVVDEVADFTEAVADADEAVMVIERGEETLTIVAIPRENPPEGEGALGVVISTTENYFPPLWQRPFYGMYYGFQDAIFWGMAVVAGFVGIFKSLFAGQSPEGVGGPIAIYAVTSQTAQYGFVTLVNFVGILSINLAILNILPFPALDGGRLLFIILEGIVGKRVLPKLETYIHMVGMAVLILMLLAISFVDIKRFYESGWDVARFLENISP